jgi:hypothetical protein
MTTPDQRKFIRHLRRQNDVTEPQLNWFVQTHFGITDTDAVDALTTKEASRLIDLMKDWRGAPADVRRAFGQLDLPGVESCAG